MVMSYTLKLARSVCLSVCLSLSLWSRDLSACVSPRLTYWGTMYSLALSYFFLYVCFPPPLFFLSQSPSGSTMDVVIHVTGTQTFDPPEEMISLTVRQMIRPMLFALWRRFRILFLLSTVMVCVFRVCVVCL